MEACCSWVPDPVFPPVECDKIMITLHVYFSCTIFNIFCPETINVQHKLTQAFAKSLKKEETVTSVCPAQLQVMPALEKSRLPCIGCTIHYRCKRNQAIPGQHLIFSLVGVGKLCFPDGHYVHVQ